MKNSEIFGLIVAKLAITFGCTIPLAGGIIMVQESILPIIGIILVCAGSYAYIMLNVKYLVPMGMTIGDFFQKK